MSINDIRIFNEQINRLFDMLTDISEDLDNISKLKSLHANAHPESYDGINLPIVIEIDELAVLGKIQKLAKAFSRFDKIG